MILKTLPLTPNSMIVIKTAQQIERIRLSGTLAADALRYGGSLVKAGITTGQINDMVTAFIAGRGGKPACLGYRGFPKEICISLNDVVCHGIPGDRVLRAGDIVKIDVTTILDGFFGDTAATFSVGQISKKAQGLIDCTKKCLEIGIEQVKPGNHFGLIGYEINKYAQSEGYTVVYEFAGHGCGLAFHEEPPILHIAKADEGPIMREGMTFTIEPMICLGAPKVRIAADKWTALTNDGSLSSQFEHTIAVTKDGYDILTIPSSAS